MNDRRKNNPLTVNNVDSEQRRKTLKRAAGGAAVAMAATQGKWQKPVVDAVLLPAHAATSNPIQNLRLTVAVSNDNSDSPNASPSATAGSTTNYLNSDADDTIFFNVRIHVDPPQATPVTLSYDNGDDFGSAPASPIDAMTNAGGDVTFNFTSDGGIADDPTDAPTENFRATVTGLPQAVVHLDFS